MPGILLIKPKITLRIFCPFCLLEKHKSRKFSTVYSLKYHLSSQHSGVIYPDNLTLENVQNTLAAIEKAIQIGMVRN